MEEALKNIRGVIELCLEKKKVEELNTFIGVSSNGRKTGQQRTENVLGSIKKPLRLLPKII